MNATMSLGLDFYNGSILLEQLNNTYFLGVTGVVEFDKNLDRLPYYFQFISFLIHFLFWNFFLEYMIY